MRTGSTYLKRRNLRSLIIAASLVVCPLAVSSVEASTIVLNDSGDTTISQQGDAHYFDSTNYGGRTDLKLYNYFGYAPLLRFDTTGLSAALAGGTVNSVTLNFTVTGGDVTTSNSPFKIAQLSAANAGWVEGSGSGAGDNASTGATRFFMNRDAYSDSGTSPYSTGTAWAGGGVLDNYYNGPDQFVGNAATVYDLGLISGTYTSGSTFSLTLDNNIIANWIADPSLAQAGLLLVITGGGSNFAFNSAQAGSGAPTITVDFTAVPEPGSASLFTLGMGAMLYMSRRRAKIA